MHTEIKHQPNRKERRATQASKRSKHPQRPQRWRLQYTAWDLATASPINPMPPERYTTHMTRMHLALDAIARTDLSLTA